MVSTIDNIEQQNSMAGLTKAWYSIWYKPRGTIRAIVEKNPQYGVVLLATLSGVGRFLDQASERSLGDHTSLGWLLFTSLMIGAFGGIVALYIFAALFRWTGSWFGGVADTREVRAAVAWSSIPDLLLLPIYGVIVLLTGKEWFVSSPVPSNETVFLLLLLCLSPFGIFILIMRLFLSAKCIGEVHRFSAWKGLLTIITGFLVIIAPTLVFVILEQFISV